MVNLPVVESMLRGPWKSWWAACQAMSLKASGRVQRSAGNFLLGLNGALSRLAPTAC